MNKKCNYIWHVLPSVALMGAGCPECRPKIVSEKNLTHAEYCQRVKEIHGEQIQVIEKYKGIEIPIKHLCRCKNIWNTSPKNALNSYGCRNCYATKRTKTYKQYERELKELNGDFIGVLEDYKGAHVAIKHECKKGHITTPKPVNVLNGSGCFECNKRAFVSKISIEWFSYLTKQLKLKIQTAENGKEFKIKCKSGWYSADGYNEHFNLVFEFHGDYYHGHETQRDKEGWSDRYNRTLKKTNFLLKQGYVFIYIWETDYHAGLPPTCLLTKENAHYKEWAESHGFNVRMVERTVRKL